MDEEGWRGTLVAEAKRAPAPSGRAPGGCPAGGDLPGSRAAGAGAGGGELSPHREGPCRRVVLARRGAS